LAFTYQSGSGAWRAGAAVLGCRLNWGESSSALGSRLRSALVTVDFRRDGGLFQRRTQEKLVILSRRGSAAQLLYHRARLARTV